MSEKIKKIEEVFDIKDPSETGWGSKMDGYKIVTNKQEILFLIDNGQSCCESWGYFDTLDDKSDFKGAELLSIETVDEAMNPKSLEEEGLEYGLDEGGIVFVNINTSKGTFQLAAYNAHNGYYGHSVTMKSNQLSFEEGV